MDVRLNMMDRIIGPRRNRVQPGCPPRTPRVGLALLLSTVALGCATNIDRRGDVVFRTGSCEELIDLAGVYGRHGERLAIDGRLQSAAVSFANAAAFWDALGRPDSARTYHERAEALFSAVPSDEQALAAFRQQGESLHGAGRADSALVVYRAAAAMAARRGDRIELGRALNDLGLAHHDLENPDSAFHYLGRATALQDSIGDPQGRAVTENNLGRVYQTVGRPAEAIPHFQRSLSLRRSLGDRAGEALVEGNIGYSYDLAGQPDSALHHYRRSLAMVEGVCRPSYLGLAQMNVGRAHLALGALDSAQHYLDLALESKQEVGDARGVGWALDNLGLVHRAGGRHADAIEQHARAAEVLHRIGDRARAGGALYHLGVAHTELGGDAAARRASAAFDAASIALSGIRSRAGDDPLRLSFAEQYVELYARWSLTALARPDLGPSERVWAGLAAAERGRAQALLDLLADTVRVESGAEDLPERGRALAAAAREGGADGLLYYLVTPDTLLAWLIAEDEPITLHRVAVARTELEARIREVRQSLQAPASCDFFAEESGGGDPVAALATLHALVVPPALRERLPAGAEVVIAPHGPLNLVPYGALSPGASETPLGVRYGLRYTPSLALLETVTARERIAPTGPPLIVAAPEMPRVRVCGEEFIPSAPEGQRRAGETIGRLFGVAPVSGAEATEEHVRQLLPGASLVHFGTHGFAFDTDAEARRSFITLADAGGAPPFPPENDGMLTVADVLALPRLTAELVVLSACETGMGDLKQAEGTVGLQRAFLSRGARSVLVSLWSVGDEPTAELMEHFYRHWLSGVRKAEALRLAQEEMYRRNPSPYLWSAFQLVGAS